MLVSIGEWYVGGRYLKYFSTGGLLDTLDGKIMCFEDCLLQYRPFNSHAPVFWHLSEVLTTQNPPPFPVPPRGMVLALGSRGDSTWGKNIFSEIPLSPHFERNDILEFSLVSIQMKTEF